MATSLRALRDALAKARVRVPEKAEAASLRMTGGCQEALPTPSAPIVWFSVDRLRGDGVELPDGRVLVNWLEPDGKVVRLEAFESIEAFEDRYGKEAARCGRKTHCAAGALRAEHC